MWKELFSRWFRRKHRTQAQAQDDYTAFIRKVQNLKKTRLHRVPVPDTGRHDIPKGAVAEYISYFDKLVCARGKESIQCYYQDTQLGAQPFLVAPQKPVDKWNVVTLEWLSNNAARKYMFPKEDTPMAYFQYLMFYNFGEQFALYWHALYGIREIRLEYDVHSERVEWKWDEYGRPSTDVKKGKKKRQVFTPVVTMDENCCQVELVEELHIGIMQVKYQILRKPPYTIDREVVSILVKKPHLIY